MLGECILHWISHGLNDSAGYCRRKEFLLKFGTANANVRKHKLPLNHVLPNDAKMQCFLTFLDHTGNAARKAFLQKFVLVQQEALLEIATGRCCGSLRMMIVPAKIHTELPT